MTLNKGERNEKQQDFWFCYLPKDSNSRPPSHESYFSAQDFVFSLVFWAFMLTLHHLIFLSYFFLVQKRIQWWESKISQGLPHFEMGFRCFLILSLFLFSFFFFLMCWDFICAQSQAFAMWVWASESGGKAQRWLHNPESVTLRFCELLCAVLVQILLGMYFFLLNSLEVIWKHTFFLIWKHTFIT